jgi:dTDP-4-dehydrorhamnose 3,5-epimerase
MGDALVVSPCIDGVAIYPLKHISDERGSVMHMLRSDASCFTSFGEIYFSVVKPGVVKAWKKHQRMAQNFAVPVGQIKLVIYDDRDHSPTHGLVQEIIIGVDQYFLVHIPQMLWYGFQGLSSTDAMIANCATIPHDPAEVERVEQTSALIPYKW